MTSYAKGSPTPHATFRDEVIIKGGWWWVMFNADHPDAKCSLEGMNRINVSVDVAMGLEIHDDSFTCTLTFRAGAEDVSIPFGSILMLGQCDSFTKDSRLYVHTMTKSGGVAWIYAPLHDVKMDWVPGVEEAKSDKARALRSVARDAIQSAGEDGVIRPKFGAP